MIMLGTGPNQGKLIATGNARRNPCAPPIPKCSSFINGEPDGPVPLKLSKDDYVKRLLGRPRPTENRRL